MSKAKAAFLFAVPPPLLAGGAALAAIFDEGREVIFLWAALFQYRFSLSLSLSLYI